MHDAYRKREFIDKYAYLADYKEIVENDYNLNIPRYVDTFEPDPEIDIRSIESVISDIRMELTRIEAKMLDYLQELGISE